MSKPRKLADLNNAALQQAVPQLSAMTFNPTQVSGSYLAQLSNAALQQAVPQLSAMTFNPTQVSGSNNRPKYIQFSLRLSCVSVVCYDLQPI